MPELPEVETIAKDLRDAGIINEKIDDIAVFWKKSIAIPSPNEFCKRLCGQTITSIKRRAKYLWFGLSNGDSLFLHLRMTGRLLLATSEAPRSPHEHLILSFVSKRQLRYHDTRKFGRWYLVADPKTILNKLGPDPFDPEFTLANFKHRIQGKKRQLKPLLLDQSFIGGLGNIYVDEALWEAKLHPQTLCNALSSNEIILLYQAIHVVLKRGLKAQGTTLGKGTNNFYRLDGSRGKHQLILNVFRRTSLPCPRCGSKILRLIIAQRSTHLCPSCQLKKL